MEQKHKHLEFIQNVVSRMARHSFILKGWSVTLVVALFASATKDTDMRFILIVFMPVLIFWFLDSYYLQRERMFRALYDEVRIKKDNQIDYSMHVKHLKRGRNLWWRSFLSGTLLIFYVPLLIIMVIVISQMN